MYHQRNEGNSKKVQKKGQHYHFTSFVILNNIYNHLSDNDQIYLIDTIADNNSDPKAIVKAKLLRELAFEYLDNDFDKEVLKMRLLGYNYQQMSEALNCTKKKIDNSLQRIKQKLISLFD